MTLKVKILIILIQLSQKIFFSRKTEKEDQKGEIDVRATTGPHNKRNNITNMLNKTSIYSRQNIRTGPLFASMLR